MPARVILQDFTGVPAVVDLASMRGGGEAAGRRRPAHQPAGAGGPGGRPLGAGRRVRLAGRAAARTRDLEFERNRERYEFLRWGQKAFANFRVVPPATGIVHQVNLEYLAQGVLTRAEDGAAGRLPRHPGGHRLAHHHDQRPGRAGLGRGRHRGRGGDAGPAALHGHAAGGGLQAHRAACREGVTATDLVLTVTQMLRKKGVVEKFVEFFGPGPGPDDAWPTAPPSPTWPRSTAPPAASSRWTTRRCATCAAPAARRRMVDLVERYTQGAGAVPHRPDARTPSSPTRWSWTWRRWSRAWPAPSGPQDRVPLAQMKTAFRQALTAPVKDRGFGLSEADLVAHGAGGRPTATKADLQHGAVVIAAITSCTNTSNPSVMLGAGLLARKAVAKGLQVPGLREDQPGPRLQGGDRVPEQGRPHARPGSAGLPPGRLRLHHLHRQQRARCRRRCARR